MTLSDVIAQVESANNPYAVRFEPAVFQKLSADPQSQIGMIGWIQRVHSCSQSTAIMIASTSWGKYQLMGENLWPHLEDSFWTYGASPILQDQTFGDFLVRHGINYSLDEMITDPVKREDFIRHYNGPGAIDEYWNRMKQAIGSLPDA